MRREHALEHRLEPLVHLHGQHPLRPAGQQRRHHARARADFQHIVLRGDVRQIQQVRKQRVVEQEILAQRVRRAKIVPVQRDARAQAG